MNETRTDADPRRLVWIQVPGADPVAASRLHDLLEDDFELIDPATSAGVEGVVAVLPPAPLECDDEAVLDTLAQAADRLIPVVFGDRASTLLASRSQIVRPPGDEREAARRVASLVALGGQSLVEVNALTASARRWDERGRRPADLLGGAATAAAPALVARASQSDHPDLELISQFAVASERRQRRLRQRRWLISAVAAIVLLAVGTVSAVQKVNADRAAEESREKAAAALANRLSSQVLGMLGEHPDPDVVWSIALAALQAQPNDQSIRAAQLVRASVPRHRSIALGRVAIAVSGADTGSFALRFRDGSAQVRGPDLTIWRDATRVNHAVLSNDGSHLALIGATIRLNSAADTRFPEAADMVVKAPGEVLDAAWAGTDLWLLTASGVFAVAGGELSPRLLDALPSWLGKLRRFDVAADGSRVAVVGAGGAVVVDRPAGTIRFAKRSDSVGNAVLNADAKVLYLHDQTLRVTVVVLTSKKPAEHGETGALMLRRAGDLIVKAPQAGLLCPMSPPAVTGWTCVTAHGGLVHDIATAGPNGYVTVGQDGYLRLWQTLNAASYPAPSMNASDDLSVVGGMDAAQARGSLRSRIEFVADSDELRVLTQPRGILTLVSPEFRAGPGRFLGLPFAQTWWDLAPGGKYLGRYSSPSGSGDPGSTASVIDLASTLPAGTDRLRWSATAVPQLRGIAAVSADGQELASASPQSVYAWRNGTRLFGLRSPGTPVGIVFGSSGPRVYFADGQWVDSDDEAHDFGTPLLAITGATGQDGVEHLAWVTGDRVLMESIGGQARRVATLPAGLPVYAMKYSTGLSRIAVFADSEAAVIRTSDGVQLFASRAAYEWATVQDLAFLTEDRLVSVENSGGLRHVDLLASDALRDEFQEWLPRPLSSDEEAALGLQER